MSIKFKKLHENATLPSRAFPTDTGWDITATTKTVTERYIEYGCGLSVELPLGYGLQVRPRSSISKYDLIMCNAPGSIDNEYRGEIKVRFKLMDKFPHKIYDIGDRIAQLVLERVLDANIGWVDELSTSMRDKNGFGSTGV